MARRPYAPSGKTGENALPVLFAASLGAGLLAGAVEGFVSKWFSLLLLFPLALGFVVGLTGSTLVASRQVRAPLMAALAALLGSLAAEGALHVMKYREMRASLGEALSADADAAAFVQANGVDRAVDQVLAGDEGNPPFIGFLKLAAEQGVSITRAGHSGSKPTLTGVGVYALWLINLIIAVGVALWLTISAAREPYCENCSHWYDERTLVVDGNGERAGVKETLSRLEGGQYAEAIRSAGVSDGKTALRVSLRSCRSCRQHDPLLTATHHTALATNKPQESTKYTTLVSQVEAQAMLEAMPKVTQA